MPDFLVLLVQQEFLVALVCLVRWDLPVREDKAAHLGLQVSPDLLVRLEHLDSLDHRDSLVPLEALALQVPEDSPVLLVPKVHLDSEV